MEKDLDMKLYNEYLNGKKVLLDAEPMMMVNIYNYLETENNWQTFLASIVTSIKKTKYNEKECYIINDFASTMTLMGIYKNEIYIEKDTGLFIKSNIDNSITEREYEFDNVDDSIFVEPNVGEYEIIKNE